MHYSPYIYSQVTTNFSEEIAPKRQKKKIQRKPSSPIQQRVSSIDEAMLREVTERLVDDVFDTRETQQRLLEKQARDVSELAEQKRQLDSEKRKILAEKSQLAGKTQKLEAKAFKQKQELQELQERLRAAEQEAARAKREAEQAKRGRLGVRGFLRNLLDGEGEEASSEAGFSESSEFGNMPARKLELD